MTTRAVAEAVRIAGGGDTPVYAGQIPLIPSPDGITVALTEAPGESADPRQKAVRYFDNPGYTLHIISDDLVLADTYAQTVLGALYRASHIRTDYGSINTLTADAPRRVVRTDRPRYDLQMDIRAEVVRISSIVAIIIGGYAFTITDGQAYLSAMDYFAGMGFGTETIDITES